MIDTAIILAGGLGTRLRPLTDTTPKPLLPLKGKPILQHTIEQLQKFGVTEIILSIGFLAEQIKNYFGDGSRCGVKITYSIEYEPLGTGGAIKKACQGLSDPVFVVWGDNLMDIDYRELYATYQKHRTPVMMALTPREDVEHFGVARLEGEKILAFMEKPPREKAPSNFINAGAIVLEPEHLSILPEGKSSIERDFYEKLQPGEITAYFHQGQWFPTDTLEKYAEACRHFLPDIDFSKKKVVIADVNDTICHSCQQLEPDMAAQIDTLIQKGYTFAFISGTPVPELQRMISSRLQGEHHLLANTGTHYAVARQEKTKTIYDHALMAEEKKKITDALEKLIVHYDIQSLTTKEDQLQDRGSQITLSAIGRKAPTERKREFDPDGKKRLAWIAFLKQHLDEKKYELKIGGTTSIDITRKGLDKEWGIRTFLQHQGLSASDALFFGDKIFPGGNDYAASRIVDCVAVRNPADTLRKLREIEVLHSITDERPWGSFEQFIQNAACSVKIINVKAGKRLSLQSHQLREELLIALDDGIVAEVDGRKKTLLKGDRVFISKEAKHRLSGGEQPGRLLEISFGDFDEGDITRYEDDFGRSNQK